MAHTTLVRVLAVGFATGAATLLGLAQPAAAVVPHDPPVRTSAPAAVQQMPAAMPADAGFEPLQVGLGALGGLALGVGGALALTASRRHGQQVQHAPA